MDMMPIPLGLGTVKWGRTEGLKHASFTLPEDSVLEEILASAYAGGVRLVDTAPAYGVAEERLGKLLGTQYAEMEVYTKVGESFVGGDSQWDFSAAAVRRTVEESLRRIRREVLDGVLLHCPREDLAVITQSPALETLGQLQARGLIKKIGVSVMSLAGGLAAVPLSDVVMVSWNTGFREHEPVVSAAAAAGKRILLKKVLYSGYLPQQDGVCAVESCLQPALALSGKPTVIVGTVSTLHLQENMSAARKAP